MKNTSLIGTHRIIVNAPQCMIVVSLWAVVLLNSKCSKPEGSHFLERCAYFSFQLIWANMRIVSLGFFLRKDKIVSETDRTMELLSFSQQSVTCLCNMQFLNRPFCYTYYMNLWNCSTRHVAVSFLVICTCIMRLCSCRVDWRIEMSQRIN